ncbi:unnamed protein product [Hyaloperonospora brassicae]|uniref:Uncharacterized protein n=1 Tax=Hyaloperonospora brassicae TaxID=162125 RepID=A0AAV0THK3_HYABA|nr:unnamed protein product [Hyaloperonospora brassicae]
MRTASALSLVLSASLVTPNYLAAAGSHCEMLGKYPKVSPSLSVHARGDDSYSETTEDDSFRKVTSLQVRVQGDRPQWNVNTQRFVSSFYDSVGDNVRAPLDTVNMASVEGALKYVQAECINASVVTNCTRKNGVKYVVFYQTTVVQPPASMAYYVNASDEYNFAIEHCPFVPLDGGRCNPNAKGAFPKECNQYIGAAGETKLGFCVGGTLQDNEAIAPYPHNYWFSFPNSCPQQLWDKKTDACRKKYPGGLCPLGVEPDGVTCTFSYEILGYILLDDVVGITSMVNPKTKRKFADYYEFCKAGGVEFSVAIADTNVTLLQGLDFWRSPGDSNANAERSEKVVAAYVDLLETTTSAASVTEGMRPLPTVDELTAINPPCYQNSKICAEAKFGCKRIYRSQICRVCSSSDVGCVVAQRY